MLPQTFVKLSLKKLHKNQHIHITETAGDLKYLISFMILNELQSNVLLVCNNNDKALSAYNIIKSLALQSSFNNDNLTFFPEFNNLPYGKTIISQDILSQRINTLYKLLNNDHYQMVFTSYESLIRKIVHPEIIKQPSLKISINKKINQHTIIDYLNKSGYVQTNLVNELNTYAVRGEIVDIFISDQIVEEAVLPTRVVFFDDIIESISLFDPLTQKTISKLNEVWIYPINEFLISDKTVANFKYNYKLAFGEIDYKDPFINTLSNKKTPSGIEEYMPLLFEQTGSLLDYLPNVTVIFIQDSSVITPQQEMLNIWQKYENAFNLRQHNTSKQVNSKILHPEKLFYNPNVIEESPLNSNKNIIISSKNNALVQIKEAHKISLKSSRDLLLFNKNNLLHFNEKCQKLIHFIISNPDHIVFINAFNSEVIKILQKCLEDADIKYSNTKNIDLSKVQTKINFVMIKHLNQGFIINNNEFEYKVLLLTEFDLFIKNISQPTHKSIKPKLSLRNISTLQDGDLITHIKHGLGKFKELKTLNINNLDHDFLLIEYSNKDKLYVPIENLDLIGKYRKANSDDVSLDRLGSNAWQKKRTAVKEKIRDIAYDLVKVAALRNIKSGPIISVNSEQYIDFSSKFPHVETTGQLEAIADIENDFQEDKIMDRLICGDVGFGKTEVVARAVFLAINSGYQVAILTPTTLLCNQHYYSFLERFKGFNYKISQLSRFIQPKEKASIKNDLKLGKVDILIATHALLAKDIGFKNLGLLVVDEEQSFGVTHKERLKTLKENVHIITLTATPIPRTLQLALNNMKDISNISTPPINKLSTTTYTLPFDMVTIKEAIESELKRGGQIFWISPYIKNLDIIEQLIYKMTDKIKVLKIHGSMVSKNIEQNIYDFKNHKFDLLLSTSIVESGLDIAKANTIIITDAHNLGLAQLYQLRGRVGRRNIQSYAYITYPNNLILSENAKKRLEAIQNSSYLGASFALAEQDLEIRGAGNIIGEEQSGHIKEVGFDLYQKLLSSAIKSIDKKDINTKLDYQDLSPTIDLGLSSLIPKHYIKDNIIKLDFYDRLSNAETSSEISDILYEIIDRFGKAPEVVENLITSFKIRLLCKQISIEKLSCSSKGVSLAFHENQVDKFEQLLSFVNSNPSVIQFRPDNSLFLKIPYNKTDENPNDKSETQIPLLITWLNKLKNI